MPSRRRLRGPLHPRNRPPPSSFENDMQQDEAEASSSMPPPTTTPSSKKREWTSTIGRGGLGSLPWEQMGPSSSGPSQPNAEPPRAEFNFQSPMGFPTSNSAASLASMGSMPSSSSSTSFASFRQAQTPMSSSPSSFRTADADESSYFARSTIFSRGNQSAQAMLRETSRGMQDSGTLSEEQPRKRRRGLAGTIVDTALNAALYTGAAALTAYSLWSSWGQSAEGETQRHNPDAGPQADMGFVVSPNDRSGKAKEMRLPGGLDEPPPPYIYEDLGTPSKGERNLPPQPSTPQSNSVRTRKVFVSSQRNRRRPTFQGSKTSRQNTPRKGLPESFRSPSRAASPSLPSSSSQLISSDAADEQNDEDEEEDEDDEMLSRFEAKMAALIAEGQAALNSTPVLQESDLRDIDTASPSLHLGGSTTQRFDSPFSTPSVVPRSSSNPDELGGGVLPEPVKRTFATPNQSLKHSRSAFDFGQADEKEGKGRGSPFVFGKAESPSAAASPSARAVGRRVTDFGSANSPSFGRASGAVAGGASPYSRIPRSTSTLQARKSAVEPRPSPF